VIEWITRKILPYILILAIGSMVSNDTFAAFVLEDAASEIDDASRPAVSDTTSAAELDGDQEAPELNKSNREPVAEKERTPGDEPENASSNGFLGRYLVPVMETLAIGVFTYLLFSVRSS
jgi:hypothetical protein